MAATLQDSPIFRSHERVLCYHGPLIYEAKVLKIKMFEHINRDTGTVGPHYLVHYKGWKQTWDEWVPGLQLLKYNEANLAMQNSLQQANPGTFYNGSTDSKTQPQHNKSAGKVPRNGTRGRKRPREQDDNTDRPFEMKLNVPDVLKSVLIDDREAVTKSNQLVTLLREPNVAQVLSQFSDYIITTKPSHLKEPILVINTVVEGLQNYFDRALGNILLYEAERLQYATIRRKFWTGPDVVIGQEREMSLIYGAEHLLRMLVKLPQIISTTNLDTESVLLIRDYVNELFIWMVQEKNRIFQEEYENATPDYYHKLS